MREADSHLALFGTINKVNATSVYRSRCAENNTVAAYDVGGCIRSWGRRGFLWGSIFGFALGAIFVAAPHTPGLLTFGIAGTLIVCAIECAVVAAGFAVLMAALHGQGVLSSEQIVLTNRARKSAARLRRRP